MAQENGCASAIRWGWCTGAAGNGYVGVTLILLLAILSTAIMWGLYVDFRDIKADNLLWSDDSDDPLQLRLADWGLAELAPKRPLIYNSGLERSSRTAHSRPRNDAPAVGSTWYMSPEVRCKPCNSGHGG